MNSSFPRTLSLLRKEKGLSQKYVAAELKVSQALLSHYENGVREPGLAFVVAAADFYGVSADFLLGRTMSRDGTSINFEELHDEAALRDNRLRGSAMSLFSKKILVNSISILFDLLGKSENRSLVLEAYNFLGCAIYKLFRKLYMRSGAGAKSFFAVPEDEFSDSADANMKLSEMRFSRALAKGQTPPSISNDSLTRDYPLLVQSLLSMIHSAEKEAAKLSSGD